MQKLYHSFYVCYLLLTMLAWSTWQNPIHSPIRRQASSATEKWNGSFLYLNQAAVDLFLVDCWGKKLRKCSEAKLKWKGKTNVCITIKPTPPFFLLSRFHFLKKIFRWESSKQTRMQTTKTYFQKKKVSAVQHCSVELLVLCELSCLLANVSIPNTKKTWCYLVG